MPELPEVETTRRGIAPHVEGRRVATVVVRQPSLRWPVPVELPRLLRGQQIQALERRAKYLLFRAPRGTMLVHLGMSGSLRIVPATEPVRKHDHLDVCMDGNTVLRFHDPRRFGCVLWVPGQALLEHPLLAALGPEPLAPDFDAAYLYARARGRKTAIKSLIMDGRVVVGVGNIYANEALFGAGILPTRAAGAVSLARCARLVDEIKAVLARAIEVGGTTLRDFVGGDGKPGYFQQTLTVYGRAGQVCQRCAAELKECRLGQRSTVYCPRCQR